MAPKAKKGKKKAPEVQEPPHDPTWERVSVHAAYLLLLHTCAGVCRQ